VTDLPARLDNNATSHNEASSRRNFNGEAISAGLHWLSAAQRHDHWTDPNILDGASDICVTACVLARLGEAPAGFISYSLRQQIERSLDWLERARVAGQGWSGTSSGEPDSFTTSWAMLALRSHGRSVPRTSLDLLLRCRQPNGGFSAYPQGACVDRTYNASSPEITVTALRALSMCDSVAEAFLASQLRGETAGNACGRAARLYICSEVLDWESGLGSWPLLDRISQCIAASAIQNSYEQALVLRSLLRLRNQKAWAAGAALREAQLDDGSWPAVAVSGPLMYSSADVSAGRFAGLSIMATVTAISALVLSEWQPGLYFGSDLPLPRRFRNC